MSVKSILFNKNISSLWHLISTLLLVTDLDLYSGLNQIAQLNSGLKGSAEDAHKIVGLFALV